MAVHYVIDPDRLCDAADSLLRAIQSRQGKNALIEMRVSDPYARQTVSGKVFTQCELVEAMDLLLRLGLVSRAAARH